MFLYCLVLAYRLVFIYNTIHTLLLGLHYVQVYSSPACSLSSRPDLMFVQMHCKCVRNTHTVVWLGYHTGHALPMEVLLVGCHGEAVGPPYFMHHLAGRGHQLIQTSVCLIRLHLDAKLIVSQTYIRALGKSVRTLQWYSFQSFG